jgi:hypothetical protein
MSMLISSMKRRNEALQNECDTLAQGIDNLSSQLTEAYARLQKHEPEYVVQMLNPGQPPAAASAPATEPAAAPSAESAEAKTIN